MHSAHLRASLAASIVSVLVSVASGGCKSTPAPATPATTVVTPVDSPPGTSGLPGLDWGANVDDITATFTSAKSESPGLTWSGPVIGEPAHVAFAMDGDGLEGVEIAWDADFASMGECGDTLHKVRGRVDAALGPGGEDNLAVFWDTPTASVVMACNPTDDDSGRARLTQSYQRKAAE
jgi:hypothetical protein